MIIETPVRMTTDQLIVDKNNKTVCVLCWRNELDHVRKQEQVGKVIVDLINSSLDGGVIADKVDSDEESTVTVEKKKRGRPFGWRKELANNG